MISESLVVGGGLFAAVVSLLLAWRLTAYRDKPGATWLAVTLASQSLFCAASAVSLLVFDETLRLALEMIAWVGLASLPAVFLRFSLAYSGRVRSDKSWLSWARFSLPLLAVCLTLTNPWYHLMWTGFRLSPVGGLATVRYSLTTVGSSLFVLGLLVSTAGAIVLLETAASYSLYRAEATAIAVSAVPPVFAGTLWFLKIGPYPELNLMPLFFIPHVAADAYAILATDIFEYNPRTRRIIDATAIDHLESPLVVVNANRRVVNLNAAATDIFGVSRETALKAELDELAGNPVDLHTTDATVAVTVAGVARHFAVSPATQTDSDGTLLGHSVIFQDITAQRRREQRLDVLNRVLRHNLRNDLNVILGNVRLARDNPTVSTDGGVDTSLATAERNAQDLMTLAEDARAIDRVVDRASTAREAVSIRTLVDDVVDEEGDGRITDIDVPASHSVETNPTLLTAMLARLVSAAVEYTDCPLSIRLVLDDSGAFVFGLFGDDSFPEHEVAALTDGGESPLKHASGLDLWVAQWGADVLNYELRFNGEGTLVTLHFTE